MARAMCSGGATAPGRAGATDSACTAGPASLQPIQTTDPVGYCYAALDYLQPIAGEPSEVQVDLECWTAFAVGDAITFVLPGFELAAGLHQSQVVSLNGTLCFWSTNTSNGTYSECNAMM